MSSKNKKSSRTKRSKLDEPSNDLEEIVSTESLLEEEEIHSVSGAQDKIDQGVPSHTLDLESFREAFELNDNVNQQAAPVDEEINPSINHNATSDHSGQHC